MFFWQIHRLTESDKFTTRVFLVNSPVVFLRVSTDGWDEIIVNHDLIPAAVLGCIQRGVSGIFEHFQVGILRICTYDPAADSNTFFIHGPERAGFHLSTQSFADPIGFFCAAALE